MPNRYCRDELIKVALDMVHLPNLEAHDMPHGVVQQDAFAIQWLQDILDFWYNMIPFSSTVTSAPLPIAAHQSTLVLPEDLILDVRNGYIVRTILDNPQSNKRMRRLPFQKFLPRTVHYSNAVQASILYPYFYCIIGRQGNQQTMMVAPVPTVNVLGTLWYYQLPPRLEAGDKPTAPSDYICAEYIRVRALEWANLIEPGMAQKFCDKLVGAAKAAGLLNEPEDDEVPFDDLTLQRGTGYSNTYAWMGPI